MSKLPVSVCMIAKNEEKTIERCLSSLAPYGFEIVVVDTGSTDKTKEIAAKYTDRIFDFKWINDFSAARNYSIKMATNNWIFVMDCDEWIKSINLPEIECFYKNCPHDLGFINLNNLTDPLDESAYNTSTISRLFSRKTYHYEGIIHEQLVSKFPVQSTHYLLETTIGHSGYCISYAEHVDKSKRNLSLLFKQMIDEPNNPYIYFQIGKSYDAIEDYQKACLFYEKALSYDSDSGLDYICNAAINYGCDLLRTGQKEKALSLRNFYNSFSYSADFVYTMGLIYLNSHLYEEALDEFQKALTYVSSTADGVTSFLSYYQIGLILEMAGETETAINYFKLCGDFPPALTELKTLMQV